MKNLKSLFATGLFVLLPMVANAVMPHVGFYQTIDDKTNKPKSIVYLYEYLDEDDVELAARLIALYGDDGKISETLSNPTRIATEVDGSPKMVGLDIIWEMEWDADDKEYEDGKIMDPKNGKIYSSVIWQENAEPTKLRVRGKIGPFGRTQTWNVMNVKDLPADLQNLDSSKWTPVIRD